MINYEKFKNLVGGRFWKHIHQGTLLPYQGTTPRRETFLKRLTDDIQSMRYVPMPPRGYVVSHKQNLVVRFVPSLKREDYCVYFFCVRCLEDEIAKNRIKGTYGGWKLGGRIRQLENFDDAFSMPDSSYDKFAWKQAWTDYQKKAYKFYSNNQYRYFIVFDVANFYDSIRLGRLETLVRESVDKRKTQVVNLLFYFLSNWGKRDLNYAPQTIGVPQDEVGDCSRILANFYLQDYDKKIFDLANSSRSGYLRYADDQIIAAPSEKVAKNLMFQASKELAKLGLNLNASKARFFTRKEFNDYWSFDIFKLLEDPNDLAKIQKAFSIYKARLASNIKFRPEAVLKRLLSCNLRRLPAITRNEILRLALQKDFLTSVNEYYYKRIYQNSDASGKNNFLKQLNDLSDEVLFNQFHLRVMKFARDNNINRSKLGKVKTNLLSLKDINP